MQIAMVAAGFRAVEAEPVAPLHGDLQADGRGQAISRSVSSRACASAAIRRKFVENCFKQIEGFGEYGFPESHAASFALLVYASAWIKCHYPDVFAGGAAQQPADGLLCDVAARARRAGARRRGAAGRRECFELGLHAGERSAAARRSASAPCFDERRYSDDACRSSWLSPDRRLLRGMGQENRKRARRAASIPSAISGCAPVCHPRRCKKLAHADAFNSLGLSRRDALWAVKALQKAGDKDNLPLFARVDMPELEPDVAFAVDAAGRAGDRGLSPSASVAEGASGVVPARAISMRAASFGTICFPARPGPARHHRRHRAGPPAARHRQCHLHDAGGRDRRSPTPSSGRASSSNTARS